MGNTFVCLPSDKAVGIEVTADLDISFSRVPSHSLARRHSSLKPRADCHLSMPTPAACPELRKRRRHGRPWTGHLQPVPSVVWSWEPTELTCLEKWEGKRYQSHPGANSQPLPDLWGTTWGPCLSAGGGRCLCWVLGGGEDS